MGCREKHKKKPVLEIKFEMPFEESSKLKKVPKCFLHMRMKLRFPMPMLLHAIVSYKSFAFSLIYCHQINLLLEYII